MDLLRVVVAALATWRLTQFLVIDDGPWDVVWRIRKSLGRYAFVATAADPRISEISSGFGRFLECAHCVGKWVAVGMAVLVLWPSQWGDLFILAWGLAGAQSLVEGRRSCHDVAIEVRRAERRTHA
jgi:hypothetical protein